MSVLHPSIRRQLFSQTTSSREPLGNCKPILLGSIFWGIWTQTSPIWGPLNAKNRKILVNIKILFSDIIKFLDIYLTWRILGHVDMKFVEIKSLGYRTSLPKEGVVGFHVGKDLKTVFLNHWLECIFICYSASLRCVDSSSAEVPGRT